MSLSSGIFPASMRWISLAALGLVLGGCTTSASSHAPTSSTTTQAACKSLTSSLQGFDRFAATAAIDVNYVTITWPRQLREAAALGKDGPMRVDFAQVAVAADHWNLDDGQTHTRQQGDDAMRLIRGVAVKCADQSAPTSG